jgi:hypothetical protein
MSERLHAGALGVRSKGKGLIEGFTGGDGLDLLDQDHAHSTGNTPQDSAFTRCTRQLTSCTQQCLGFWKAPLLSCDGTQLLACDRFPTLRTRLNVGGQGQLQIGPSRVELSKTTTRRTEFHKGQRLVARIMASAEPEHRSSQVFFGTPWVARLGQDGPQGRTHRRCFPWCIHRDQA